MRTQALTFCTLLASTSLASPAFAQTYQPMERQAPDDNGVDVITGKVTMSIRSVSVGNGDSLLTYSKGWAAGIPFDTFDVNIVNMGSGQPTLVTLFGDQRRFTGSSGNWTNADGDGGSLTNDATGYTYTARDGTVFRFLNSLGSGTVLARVSTITKPNGEVLHYWYATVSGITRLQSVTSSLGYMLKATYASNSAGTGYTQLTKVTAVNNAVDNCAPDANTCPTYTQTWPELTISTSTSGGTTTQDVADDLGRTIQIQSGGGGVTTVTPPGATTPAITYSYYGDGRVQTLSKGGGTWTYSYADSGTQRTTTVAQPLGGSKVYVTDLNLKRVISVTDELSHTTSITYDSFGRPTRTTQQLNDYAELTYDARGNVTQTKRDKPSSSVPPIIATASFDTTCSNAKTCNQPNSTTDARGNVTDYTYDSGHGGVLTITAPEPSSGAVRPQVRFTYDALYAWYKNYYTGVLQQAPTPVTMLKGTSQCQTSASCSGGADEVKTTIGRGSSGVANNLLAVSMTEGSGNGALIATTAITYDAIGNVVTVDGPLSGADDAVTYDYDSVRQIGSFATSGWSMTYTRDDAGRIIKAQRIGYADLKSDTVTAEYDVLGRVTRQTTQNHFATTTYNVTQYTYDAKGRPRCIATRMNSANFLSYQPSCTINPTGTMGPDRIIQLDYDNADRLWKKRVGIGTSDAADEMTFTYTDNDQAETFTDGEVNKTTFEYDELGRLVKTRYPLTTKGANASSTTDYEQITYENRLSNTRTSDTVASVRLRDSSSIALAYDNLGRVTTKDLPSPEGDVTYSYDLLDRTTGASQSGATVSFGYDALSRQTSDQQPLGTMSRQFDLAGRITKVTWPDTFYVDYDYLSTGELWRVRENGATSGAGVLATFAYDGLGQRTSLIRGNGRRTLYEYDGANRLSALVDTNFGSPQDVRFEFVYNPANQIVTRHASIDAYAWTGHGNGSTATVADGLNRLVSVGGTSAAYDARGNLTTDPTTAKTYTYTSENAIKTASGGVALAYDPVGRLADYNPGTASRFISDGLQVAVEANSAGAVQKRWVWAGMDEPLVEYSGSGTSNRKWLLADERGSIIAQSDSTGAVTQINKYDEYGKPQSTNTGRFQYTGQMWLPEAGAYHYKMRAYEPVLGRFMQTDPIGYVGGANLYAYVNNDSVNLVDPMGLQAGSPPSGPLGPGDVERCLLDPNCDVVTADNPFANHDDLAGIAPLSWTFDRASALESLLHGARGGSGASRTIDLQCRIPAVSHAMSHPDFHDTLREALRVSKLYGNIETGFNFGEYLFGGEGFGDVYKGYRRSIIFRSGIDSLFMDGIPNPSVHFHIHPPGYPSVVSVFDKNFARSTNAVVVALSTNRVSCTNAGN